VVELAATEPISRKYHAHEEDSNGTIAGIGFAW
jgi:hypothetical protein